MKSGNIWINIHKLGETDPAYAGLLDAIFAEFESRVPGLATYKRSMTLLVSSPKVKVYYHCDVPGQMLWQLRGTKRVFVYPAKPPFLTQPSMEKIVLGEAHETGMPYEPWFDDYAEIIDLECRRDALLAAQLPASRGEPRLPERLGDDRALDRRAQERLRRQLRERHPPPRDRGKVAFDAHVRPLLSGARRRLPRQ